MGLQLKLKIIEPPQIQPNPNHPLHIATYQNNLETIKQLLEQGTDITEQDEKGLTAAHWAAWQDYPEMLKFISSKGGSLLQENNEGYSPFDLAIVNNSQQVVKWFVSQHKEYFINVQDVNENTPLLTALVFNHSEMAQFLIKQGADVNVQNNTGLTPLNATALTNNVEMAQFLVQQGAELNRSKTMSPLYLAATNNNIKMAQFLIEQGLDINKPVKENKNIIKIFLITTGGLPLILPLAAVSIIPIASLAAVVGGAALVFFAEHVENNLVVDKNSEAYKKAKEDIKNISGTTPLHIATFKGHSEMVDLLIQYEADVNFESKTDYTPLHFAVQEGHLDIVKKLVNNHADINAISDDGTLLHIAVANNNIDMVSFLLTEVKVDPNIAAEFNVEGKFLDVLKSPLDLALEKGHLHIANILQNHGAQEAKDIFIFDDL